jgi:hypothetical protein
MTNTAETSRLCQLILQDYNGYRASEAPEVLAILRTTLEQELIAAESELVTLDVEYRQLIKSDDTNRRMEVGNRKLYLSRRSEEIARMLTDSEALKLLARSQYAKTQELQDSLVEQRQIINSLWSK